jgi:predicted phosphodiesterase
MSKIRFIGDIHGDMSTYFAIIDDANKNGIEKTVQVGDFGIGFIRNPIGEYDTEKNLFIRGNHDCPYDCTLEPNWIKDGTYKDGLMYVGGATSIDKLQRKEGVDWWPDEVFSYSEGMDYLNTYEDKKPKIMVTHDIPEFVTTHILDSTNNGSHAYKKQRYYDPSIVRQVFEAMYDFHQPKLWIFGHWHLNFSKRIGETQFICLNINNYIDIDPDEV